MATAPHPASKWWSAANQEEGRPIHQQYDDAMGVSTSAATHALRRHAGVRAAIAKSGQYTAISQPQLSQYVAWEPQRTTAG